MMVDLDRYLPQILALIDKSYVNISNILPSEWCEQNRIIGGDGNSALKGRFSYKNTPYCREVVDFLHPSNPFKYCATMKGSQSGFSTGVIEPGIGWMIDCNPANTMFLVGTADLVKESVEKLDSLFDNTGIREKGLIRSNSKKARNTKTGDTDARKDYPGGHLTINSLNFKNLRNVSMQNVFADDLDAMKSVSKEDGDIISMIEKRTTAFKDKKKVSYISTPTVKGYSTIEKEYLKGDQRKYHMPCPCCDTLIVWEWENFTWKLDENNDLITESVGYVCQECNEFFDDRNKMELLNKGVWIPTAKPIDNEHISYHLPSLLSPTFMDGWTEQIRTYLEANPIGGKRNEEKHRVFCNLVLGITYEQQVENVKADELQNNIRPYDIGVIPESLSEQDGNGRIVLITLGSDLNGTLEDARLDYEIVAHSESGATYSIDHGSIGSFIPKDTAPELRHNKKTYIHGRPNSVWPILEEIIRRVWFRDSDGVGMRVMMSGIDVGYQQEYALQFINSMDKNVVGLKGDGKAHIGFKKGDDVKQYRKSSSLARTYNVESNLNKDNAQRRMGLKWNKGNEIQPYGFMNFPKPSDGKYLFSNYFSHFEAESQVYDPKTKRYVWRKADGKQNHLFDCNIYADVCKYIFLDAYFRDNKINNGVWSDYVDDINKKRRL